MRCVKCDRTLEQTLVYVKQHNDQYCWTCVQAMAQEAERTTQSSLAKHD